MARRSRGGPLPLAAGVGYVAPFPGYVPYPLPYPMFPPPPAMTSQGIGSLRWSLALGAATQAVYVPAFVWTAMLVSRFQPFGPQDFGLSLGTIAFQCAAGILGFVAVILFTIGMYYAYGGREEYGPEHTREIERSVIFFIIALVMGLLSFVGGVGPAPLGIGSALTPVGGAFGTVRGLFVGLLLRSVVKVFLPREDRGIAWIGTTILSVPPAIGSVVSVIFFLFVNSSETVGLSGSVAVEFLAAAGLASAELVGYIIFLWIYTKVLRRMRAGEFPAVPRPPMMFVPYYPVYPAYPAYPAYPQAPHRTPPDQPPP